MGNTVSAAEVAAAQIVHPNESVENGSQSPHKHHFDTKNYSGAIPAECPMHKKQESAASECPVQGGQGDINPLNMVGLKSLFS